MARWPICVALPPGLSADLASWPDDPEILSDAVERLHAARSALARELGAGVRARRGDAHERAAWSALLERAPELPPERAGARAAGVGSTRARLDPAFGAEDAAPSAGDRRRRSAAARTPSSASPGGAYRRLASSQLRGLYSLSASAEFRAAEAAARLADERVEPSVSGADGSAASPESLRPEDRVERFFFASADSDDSDAIRARFRFRDAEASALTVAAPSAADASTRVFLCATARPGSEAAKSAENASESLAACFLLERRFGDEKMSSGARPESRSGASSEKKPTRGLSVVATRLPTSVHLELSSRANATRKSLAAFGAAPDQPWVAVAGGNRFFGRASRGERKSAGTGVRVFPLNANGEKHARRSSGVFLDTPFAPTRLAASRDGEWLAACGARGVSAVWRRAARERLFRPETGPSPGATASGSDAPEWLPVFFSPPVLLAAPRYGGVAPKGVAPDVLAFSDDGRTLAAVHDGALFATWTRSDSDDADGTSASPTWRLRGASYSTRETVCDGALHVFGEANDATDESANRAFGFAFGDGSGDEASRAGERPSLLAALARAKPEAGADVEARRARSKSCVRVGLLDHTAGRGEAHRGAVFGGATDDDDVSALGLDSEEKNKKNPEEGSGFDPVALAGARGGYAAVVGADGAAYVWDVVKGATLDSWTVGDGTEPGPLRNVRVAVDVGRGSLETAVAFESGDDVVVETRRVCFERAEETEAEPEETRSKRRKRTPLR